MINTQKFESIETGDLCARCEQLRSEGYRLVQIGCSRVSEGVEINYSFDKDYELLNLQIRCGSDTPVPSIQSVYLCAFIYENEISELFGIKITDMAVDFKGGFYKTSMSAPFAAGAEEKEADK